MNSQNCFSPNSVFMFLIAPCDKKDYSPIPFRDRERWQIKHLLILSKHAGRSQRLTARAEINNFPFPVLKNKFDKKIAKIVSLARAPEKRKRHKFKEQTRKSNQK